MGRIKRYPTIQRRSTFVDRPSASTYIKAPDFRAVTQVATAVFQVTQQVREQRKNLARLENSAKATEAKTLLSTELNIFQSKAASGDFEKLDAEGRRTNVVYEGANDGERLANMTLDYQNRVAALVEDYLAMNQFDSQKDEDGVAYRTALENMLLGSSEKMNIISFEAGNAIHVNMVIDDLSTATLDFVSEWGVSNGMPVAGTTDRDFVRTDFVKSTVSAIDKQLKSYEERIKGLPVNEVTKRRLYREVRNDMYKRVLETMVEHNPDEAQKLMDEGLLNSWFIETGLSRATVRAICQEGIAARNGAISDEAIEEAMASIRTNPSIPDLEAQLAEIKTKQMKGENYTGSTMDIFKIVAIRERLEEFKKAGDPAAREYKVRESNDGRAIEKEFNNMLRIAQTRRRRSARKQAEATNTEPLSGNELAEAAEFLAQHASKLTEKQWDSAMRNLRRSARAYVASRSETDLDAYRWDFSGDISSNMKDFANYSAISGLAWYETAAKRELNPDEYERAYQGLELAYSKIVKDIMQPGQKNYLSEEPHETLNALREEYNESHPLGRPRIAREMSRKMGQYVEAYIAAHYDRNPDGRPFSVVDFEILAVEGRVGRARNIVMTKKAEDFMPQRKEEADKDRKVVYWVQGGDRGER